MMRLLIVGMMLIVTENVLAAIRPMPPAKTPRAIPAPTVDMKIAIWPAKVPITHIIRTTTISLAAQPEAIVNDRIKFVSTPELFVYLPPKEKANGTALIIFPGGGFNHLAMNLHVENVAKLLNDEGIAVFGLKYRTKNGGNDAVADSTADALQSIRVVRTRAKEFGIDTHRIGVQGYSAGSTMILNVLGKYDDGMSLLGNPYAGASSRPDFAILMCPWPNGKTIDDYPIKRGAPPAFVCQAKDDEAVPYPFAMGVVNQLKENGSAVQTFVVEKGGHAAFHYGDGDNKGEGTKWPERVLPWLKEIGMMK